MKTKYIPLVLGVLILALIAVGLYYIKSQGLVDQAVQTAATPTPGASVSGSPTPGESIIPTATPEGTPSSAPSSTSSPVALDLTIDANGLSKTVVVLKTVKGDIRFKFYSKDAPNTTQRIVELIQMGFYNGLMFHRVVPGFVIQGGDPQGNGTGGSGKNLKAEFNDRKHIEGTVAMARANDPDSADSQFYISLGTHPHLDKKYTVFGQVISGIEIARRIQMGDKILSVSFE